MMPINNLKSPSPPSPSRREIVAEIESYQKIIDGARQVVENYKPRIDIDPEWEMVELGKIADINQKTVNPANLFSDWFRYIDISSVENGTGIVNFENIVNVVDAPSRARRKVNEGDILLSTVRPNLKAYAYMSYVPEKVIASTGFAVISCNDKIDSRYVFYMLFDESLQNQMNAEESVKDLIRVLMKRDVAALLIPVPNIENQKNIVRLLKKEEEAIIINKELILLFEQKIKDRIAKVWGE